MKKRSWNWLLIKLTWYKLTLTNIYLDAPIILNILGLCEEYEKSTALEFINIMKEQNINLFIFEHSNEEVLYLIDSSKQWINNPNYDSRKATRITRYVVNMYLTENDIQLLIKRYNDFLQQNKIKVKEGAFNLDGQYEYQIDVNGFEEKLQISQRHTREGTITKDRESIEKLIQLRKGKMYRTIEEAKHIFITDNFNVVKVSREFELEFLNKSRKDKCIPCCMTSVSLSTIIWLNKNDQDILKNISRLKFGSYCYSSLNPTPELLNKFYEEIEKQNQKSLMSGDDLQYIKRNQNTDIALSELTNNDIDSYTDETTQKIIERVKEKDNAEYRKKVNRLEDENERLRYLNQFSLSERKRLKKEIKLAKFKIIWLFIKSQLKLKLKIPCIPIEIELSEATSQNRINLGRSIKKKYKDQLSKKNPTFSKWKETEKEISRKTKI